MSDDTFECLRRHFDERQLVEIVFLFGFTTYTNLMMAKSLRLPSDHFCALLDAGGSSGEKDD